MSRPRWVSVLTADEDALSGVLIDPEGRAFRFGTGPLKEDPWELLRIPDPPSVEAEAPAPRPPITEWPGPGEEPEADPRIGRWVRDVDYEGLIISFDGHGLPWGIRADGEACAFLSGAEIIPPPSPIPAPCRPVWEAFEALSRERKKD